MKLLKKAGATSEIWQIFIADSSSTTGAGLTGLTNASAGLTAYYHRDTDTTATAISLVTMTVGTFTSSGFKEIDATNMPGWYQFCPPNAALASGAKSCAFHLKGATNMAPLPIECQLSAADVDDGVRLGLTALPNAAAAAAGGLMILGSNNTAAITIGALTTGAIACTTITASGAVAFQSTFAVTTSTSLGALSCSTLTASGAVAFQSTFAVTTSTSLAALSCTTLTASGAVAFQSTFATGAATLASLAVTGTFSSNSITVAAGVAITNSGGHAISAISTGANGSGMYAGGNGTGDGFSGDGGSTGRGFHFRGGAAGGAGARFEALAGNTAGIELVHFGSGKDLDATTTNLTLAKTTNITGFNDIAATDVVSSGAITTSGGKVSEVILTDTLTTYTGNTPQTGDVYAALNGVTVEPTSPPSSTASILSKILWLFSLGKNKRTQTSTTELVRNDADSATIGTATKSDDGVTFTRGKYS